MKDVCSFIMLNKFLAEKITHYTPIMEKNFNMNMEKAEKEIERIFDKPIQKQVSNHFDKVFNKLYKRHHKVNSNLDELIKLQIDFKKQTNQIKKISENIRKINNSTYRVRTKESPQTQNIFNSIQILEDFANKNTQILQELHEANLSQQAVIEQTVHSLLKPMKKISPVI